MKKEFLHTGFDVLLPFLVLVFGCIFSLYFAPERILNTDNSNYFFNVINIEGFWAAEKRYAVYIPQIIVLIAIKLNASLNTLLHLFSFSFTLLYLFIAVLIFALLKYKKGLIILAFGLFLGVNYSFYHPVTETHQAIAYSVLFYSAINSSINNKYLKYTIALIAFILALLAHPTAVFMLGFAVLWQMLSERNFKNVWFWLIFISLMVFAVLRSVLNQNNYDAVQYKNLYDSIKHISVLFEWNSVSYLKQRPYLYIWPLLFWIGSTILIIKQKNILKLFALLVIPVGFIIISLATFAAGDSQMMMEKSFLPAFTMIGVAAGEFVFKNKLLVIISILFFIVCFYQINNTGNKIFGKRLKAFDNFITKANMHHDKFLANIDESPEEWRNYWWATSIDMLVRSQTKHHRTITLYLYMPDENIQHATKGNSFMYVNWWPNWQVDFLNKKYFKLSNQTYQTIKLNDYE